MASNDVNNQVLILDGGCTKEEIQELDEEFHSHHLPDHACRFCFAQNVECVAKCNICNKWFCNAPTAFGASHIVNHLVRSRHMEVTLHPESPLGDSVLECYTCGCKNVFQLGFVPADADGVVVLICRDVCLHSAAAKDPNWKTDQWQPLVEGKAFLNWLTRPPTSADFPAGAPYRDLNMKKMKGLEAYWRAGRATSSADGAPGGANELAVLAMSSHNLEKVPRTFTSGEHYNRVFAPLIDLEAEYAKLTRFQFVQTDVTVKWDTTTHKSRVAVFAFASEEFALHHKSTPSPGDCVLITHPSWQPAEGIASLMADALKKHQKAASNSKALKRKGRAAALQNGDSEDDDDDEGWGHGFASMGGGRPAAHNAKAQAVMQLLPPEARGQWCISGNLIRVNPNGDLVVDLELEASVAGPWTQAITTGFQVRLLWREASQGRMLTALKAFVEDERSMSSYLYNQLLSGGTFQQQQQQQTGVADGSQVVLYERPNYSAAIPGLADLNASQRTAVKAAVENALTLIQGPPGTGKTTTSTAIVYHLALQNQIAHQRGHTEKLQQILVCAPSNIAADHLAERLHRTGLAVIRLCSKSREAGIEEELAELGDIPPPPGTALALTLNAQILALADQPMMAELMALKKIHPSLLSTSVLRQLRKLELRAATAMLKAADVVITTCMSAGDKRLSSFRFRQVLIDECAQATEMESLVPLVKGAQQVVLVGDHCQLCPVVHSAPAAVAGFSQSLFERLVLAGVRPYRLEVQYRMHPALAEFPSAAFYDGALQNGVTTSERTLPFGVHIWPNPKVPMYFYNSTGAEEISGAGTSFVNRSEASVVEKVVLQMIRSGVRGDQIGVVTPYSGQRNFLTNALGRLSKSLELTERAVSSHLTTVEVVSIDSFQGREKDFIILSCVRSNENTSIGFLADARRLNVALTRAKFGLVLVGNARALAAANLRTTDGPGDRSQGGANGQSRMAPSGANAITTGHVWLNLLNHFKRWDLIVDGQVTALTPCSLNFARAVALPSRYTAASIALDQDQVDLNVVTGGEERDAERHQNAQQQHATMAGPVADVAARVAEQMKLPVMDGYGNLPVHAPAAYFAHMHNVDPNAAAVNENTVNTIEASLRALGVSADDVDLLDKFEFGDGF